MRAAALSGAVVLALGVLLVSPWLRVRTVVWTGSLQIPDHSCRDFEAASLGQPLFLLPERTLRTRLDLDPVCVRVALRRHLPQTLEICVEPRHAVARTVQGAVLDERGRVLDQPHASAGLPILHGFALGARGDRLDRDGCRLLSALCGGGGAGGLVPTAVRRTGAEVELTLAASGTRVRLLAGRLEEQLEKLRVFEKGLGSAALPPYVDLRFRNQVVVRTDRREGGGGVRD
ncbi:MAG: cell division protein FtsQ/DivIB [Candidatus Krumholzibacteriia bacterium]